MKKNWVVSSCPVNLIIFYFTYSLYRLFNLGAHIIIVNYVLLWEIKGFQKGTMLKI